ncbi:MAG TPA: hypothetical protein DEB06_07590 [Phycisphaerales bacterium]|nr:hypothetical protein [Phycisphaerales bacterium]
MTRPSRRTIAFIAAGLVACPVCSCSIRPKAAGEVPPSPSPAFTPQRIEIHPLTSIERPANGRGSTIDAHLVFLDEASDEVKTLGVLRLELYRERGPVLGLGEREQIARWAVDLSDPAINAEAYDRVTRTYRVSLRGVTGAARGSEALVLRAWLRLPSGRQLSAERRL